jgi:hypothetical protein
VTATMATTAKPDLARFRMIITRYSFLQAQRRMIRKKPSAQWVRPLPSRRMRRFPQVPADASELIEKDRP